jgi:lipid II:glycine glycyltransferase (peptidoglycan interpeptide bridge formation enzyme)
MYQEMVSRKRFPEPNDIHEFQAIQRQLADKSKMRILLCRSNGVLCAGIVCSAIGKTGVYLFGATSDAGLEQRGSYLLHWRVVEWLKESGCSVYDLHGINPERNPGGYRFKKDFCGTNGRDVFFLGQFDSSSNRLSRACVTGAEKLRAAARSMKNMRAAQAKTAGKPPDAAPSHS